MSRFKRSRIQMIRLSVTGRWWTNKCTDESRYLQQRHWHGDPGGKLISVEKEGEFNSTPFHPQQWYSRSLWGFFGDNIHALSASVWSIPAPRVQLIWKDGRRHVSTLLIHRVHPSHQNTFGCSIEAVIGDKASPTHLLLSPNIFFFFFFVSKLLWRNIDMYICCGTRLYLFTPYLCTYILVFVDIFHLS